MAEKKEPSKTTQLDIEVMINKATQRDYLVAQGILEMKRSELTEDEGVLLVFLAWLKDKQEHGGSDFNKWLDMPSSEVVEFLNIEEDDSPKEPSGQ